MSDAAVYLGIAILSQRVEARSTYDSVILLSVFLFFFIAGIATLIGEWT